MARTIGAKDKQPRKSPVRKPKSITLTLPQVQAANLLDIPVEVYAKELAQMNKKPRKPRAPKVDWEKLAKQLQQALAMEIKENDELKTKLKVAETTVVQFGAIVSYLEGKLWKQSNLKG